MTVHPDLRGDSPRDRDPRAHDARAHSPGDRSRRGESLRGLCGGAVHLPGDAAYDLARLPWNRYKAEHPAAVAYPASPEEVAEVVRGAAREGLLVAAQGTGHGSPPLAGRLGEAVLLRTAAMDDLSIDPDRRVARAGAGVLWGDLAEAAGAHGLVGLHPSSPDVGVVGYSLGGGIGWYARRLGLQCNAVTAVELVLADGSFVRATADRDEEIFWALRGGATPLGVVCALEFALHPVETVVAGYLAWDWTAAERVLPAWVSWCAEAPEEVTSSFRLLQVPDAEGIPAELRGRRLAMVDGAVLGEDPVAATVLAPLRALRPERDSFERVPAASLVRLHLEPEGPTPAYASSILLRAFPDEAVTAVLDAVGPHSGSELAVAELRQLGGALSRCPADSGILATMDGAFLALGVGMEEDPTRWPRMKGDAARFLGALAPWASGRTYLPMLDRVSDTRKAFSAEDHNRLSRIRHGADPDGLFTAPEMVQRRPAG